MRTNNQQASCFGSSPLLLCPQTNGNGSKSCHDDYGKLIRKKKKDGTEGALHAFYAVSLSL